MTRTKRWILGGAALLLLGGAIGFWRRSAGQRATRPPRPRPATPDILLLTIDTLRADATGFSGNREVETPTLDRLAGAGRVFPDAHAHNVFTLPSHTNILTGLYPYQHGIRDNSGFRLDSRIPTLATLLKGRGYVTGAFVGAFPLDSRFGLNHGFDRYDDRYPKGKAALDLEMAERPAAEVVALALQWYAENEGHPRFLWVHVFDCHFPYRPPPPFAERYRAKPYLGEVAGVDAALAPLLEPLLAAQAPVTLIVMTSDHGEGLGDHGEDTHGLFAYEATLHVPLIVCFPRIVTPGVDAHSVRHIDIAPTILEAAGVPKPADWKGHSLLADSPVSIEEAAYFEAFSAAFSRGWAPLRGVLVDGKKLVDLPLPELYDLKSDPGETRNLVTERADLVRKLRPLIPAESEFGAQARRQPSGEEVSRLRSLGYIASSVPIKLDYGPGDDPKSLVEIDRDANRALRLYQEGDLAGAIAIARLIVQKRPSMTVEYEHLGLWLQLAGDTAGALDAYRTAVARGIASETLKAQYGLALCKAGRPRQAVELLRPLAASRDPDTLNALGIALADSGDHPESQRIFQQVLAADPENVEAYENMGVLRLRAADPAGARDLFLKGLTFDARAPRVLNGLGVALARLGNEREAIDAWAKAVSIDPKLYDALFNLGVTAAKNGLNKEARLALRRFVDTAPPALYRSDLGEARRMLARLPETGS